MSGFCECSGFQSHIRVRRSKVRGTMHKHHCCPLAITLTITTHFLNLHHTHTTQGSNHTSPLLPSATHLTLTTPTPTATATTNAIPLLLAPPLLPLSPYSNSSEQNHHHNLPQSTHTSTTPPKPQQPQLAAPKLTNTNSHHLQ